MSRKQGKATDAKRGEMLVAILNRKDDWAILQEQGWYRIPIASAPKRWPPRWLAFYLTKTFGAEAFSIRYYGRVRQIKQAGRRELFPDESSGAKSDRRYYQIFVDSLETRETPIVSRRLRRIVFIPTTWAKFAAATEINDLFDDSPLEDRLWAELKRLNIPAERQMDIKTGQGRYMLDFALYCVSGKINLEADGDTWHATPAQIPQDNERNNLLASQGWHVLRFNGLQIREQMAEYCVPQVVNTIKRLGGLLDDGSHPPTLTVSSHGEIAQQMTLFEEKAAYSHEKT
jgi:very-short-patch-repair endonuclease